MKILNYYFAGLICLMASCAKDGTEKRCDKGFTGRNCDQEIIPSKMQVTFIKAYKLPPFDTDGSNWDPAGGKPDVYFRIVEKSTGNVVYKSGTADNANPTLGVYSDLSGSNVLLNMPQGRYSMEAWDYDDFDSDDFMGGIDFTPYRAGEKFPATVDLSCSSCNTAWQLNYTYLY